MTATMLATIPGTARANVLIGVLDSTGRIVQLHAAENNEAAVALVAQLRREWADGYTVGAFSLGTFLAIELRGIASQLDRAPLAQGDHKPTEADRAFRAGCLHAAAMLREVAGRRDGRHPGELA